MKRNVQFLAIAVALSCLIGPHLRAAEEPKPVPKFEDLLPETTLAFVTAPSLAESVKRFQTTPLYQAYLEPEFQKGIEGVQKLAGAAIFQAEVKAQIQRKDILDAFNGPVALAVLGLQAVAGQKDPQPQAVLLLDTSKGEGPVRKIMDALVAGIRKQNPAFQLPTVKIGALDVMVIPAAPGKPQVHLAFCGRMLAVASDRASMEAFLQFSQNADPARKTLAGSAAFAAARKKAGEPCELFAYLNARVFLEKTASTRDEKGNRDVQNLGLDKVESIAFASQFQEKAVKDSLVLHCPDGLGGAMHLLTQTPVTLADLNVVPADALAVTVASLDMPALWRQFIHLMEKNEPMKAVDLRTGLPEIEMALGFSLEAEFLPSLGTEVVAYAVQPAGGLIPDVVAFSRLRDGATFQRCFDQLRAVMGANWNFQKIEYQGATIHYRPAGRLCPAFAVRRNYFLFSLFVPSLKRAIDQIDHPGETLDKNARFQESIKTVSGERTLLVYGDFPRVFNLAWNTVYPFARLTPAKQMPVAWEALPDARALSKHFGPLLLALTAGKDGLLVEGASPVGGALPVGAGIAILKEVQNKREEKSAEAAQQLKTLHEAGAAYLAQTGRYPAKLSDLYPQYVKDLNVFAGPGGKIENANEIDAQSPFIVVPGITANTPPNAIVVYQRIENRDRTWVLQKDGTVRQAAREEFEQQVRKVEPEELF